MENKATAVAQRAKTQSKRKTQQGYKKYLGLIIALAFLVLLVVAESFYSLALSQKERADNARLDLVGQLHSISREIIRDAYEASLSAEEDVRGLHMTTLFKRSAVNAKMFPELIDVLQDGGAYEEREGVITTISPNQNKQIEQNIEDLITAWQPLENKLNSYLMIADNILINTEKELELLMRQAKVSSPKLIKILDNILEELEKDIEKDRLNQTKVDYAIVLGVVIYFLFVIVFFIRSLLRADRQAEEARREIDSIMSSVQEGLFLVDSDLKVGSQHSQALSTIIPNLQLSGQNFESVLDKFLSRLDIDNAKRYINQLFESRIKKESLIKSLNPLSRVQVFFDDDKKGLSDKHLRFEFTRVYEGKDIKQVLVSVSDITQEVLLEKRLEKEREQNSRQVELLIKVLRVEPAILDGFLRRGQQVADTINAILRNQKYQGNLQAKATQIFREIHTFKGESSALEFDRFVQIAEEMEEKLKELLKKKFLSGDDFLSIVVNLDALIEQLDVTRALHKRLVSHSNSSVADKGASEHLKSALNAMIDEGDRGDIDAYLSQCIARAAERNYKLVQYQVHGFNEAELSSEQLDAVTAIAVQLARNAVVHGIERPEARKSAGKSRQGNIDVSLAKRNGFYYLIVEDDGKGIDVEAIREKLRTMPNFKKNPDTMSEQELQRAIFVPGLSTATSSTEDAGRGVGMDLVLDRVKNLGAKIAVNSKAGQFSRFTILLS